MEFNLENYGTYVVGRDPDGSFIRIDVCHRLTAARARLNPVFLTETLEDHPFLHACFYKGNFRCVISKVYRTWEAGTYIGGKVIFEDGTSENVVIENVSSIHPTIVDKAVAFKAFFVTEKDYKA
jgi:hypothetical protein